MFGMSGKRAEADRRLSALDALRANVMIADSKLNITYMNPAVMTLMRDAEADLKKELPQFDATSLIGSNIDIFHKNPNHQRKMLAALEKPHQTTIRIGTRVFDLLVTPFSKKVDGPASSWNGPTPRNGC